MSAVSQQIVAKAWNFAHVLRDDGLSYMAYTEQITFLLFLKMADELTKPPYNRRPSSRRSTTGRACSSAKGDELEAHYRHMPRRTRQAAGDARRDLQEGPARHPEPGHAAAADRRPDRAGEVVVAWRPT